MNFSKQTSVMTGVAAALLCFFVLARPAVTAESFLSGLHLCASSLLPALFPFFVLCNVILSSSLPDLLGRLFAPVFCGCGLRSKNAAGLLLLSWVGGYAVCAVVLQKSLKAGQITEGEASRLLVLGCCSSPGFVVGCIGGQWFHSVSFGILLYFLQLSANLLCAAVLFPFIQRRYPDAPPLSIPLAHTARHGFHAIPDAVDSSLCVCGCVLFFYIVAAVADSILPSNALFSAILRGILEISSGCAAFTALGGRAAVYGTCFCLSILSCSVFLQLFSLFPLRYGLKLLLLSRPLHGLILAAEVRLCSRFLPYSTAASVFSTMANRVVPMHRLAPDAAVCLLLFLATLLYKLRRSNYNG